MTEWRQHRSRRLLAGWRAWTGSPDIDRHQRRSSRPPKRHRVLLSAISVLLGATSLLLPAQLAGANSAVTLYVSPSGPNTTNCTSSGTACGTIQEAITDAEGTSTSDVTVEVAAGSYNENDTITVPSGDTLTLQGIGPGSPTVSGGAGSVFAITGGTVTINDFTISGGTAGSGGGVNNQGTATLTNDTLVNNTATTSGGGVFNGSGATLVLTNDTIVNNSAGTSGGGVDNQGTATLTNDTLSNDTAPSGGGLDNEVGATTIANSILSGASCSGTVGDGGYNVASDTGCNFSGTDVTNSTTINLAASLAANGSSGPATLAIGRNSSAFEEVPPGSCSTSSDERGEPRPGVAGANCDAGAFEDQLATATLNLTGNPAPGNNSFNVTLTTPAGEPAPSEAVIITDSSNGSCTATLSQSTATQFVGSCTIDSETTGETVRATYDADGGDTNYLEATSNGLTVLSGIQAITFTSSVPTQAVVGGTYIVTATGGQSGNPVTFLIDPSTLSVCKIAASTVSFTAVGTCVVDANQAGNANYSAAPQVSQGFSILPGTQTITFTSSVPASPTVGETYAVAATGGPSTNAVTFTKDSSSTAGACTVAGSTVSFTGLGTCVIDANQAGNANYSAAPQVSQSATILPGTQVIKFTSKVPATPIVGGTYAVTAAGGLSKIPIIFSIGASSTSGACTVAGSTISFSAVGTCVIDANQAGNANFSAAAQVSQSFTIRTLSTTPKLVISRFTFKKSGHTFSESLRLSCVRAICGGVVESLGVITTSKLVSEKSGRWTISKRIFKTTTVVLARTAYRIAPAHSRLFTFAVTAGGRRVLAAASTKTPLRATLTATVTNGATATSNITVH